MDIQPRPEIVKHAVILIVVSFALSLLKVAVAIPYLMVNSFIYFMAMKTAIPILIASIFVYFVWTGKNWARIILTILLAFHVYRDIFTVAPDATRSIIAASLGVMHILMQATAAVMLHMRRSNEWFVNRDAQKKA